MLDSGVPRRHETHLTLLPCGGGGGNCGRPAEPVAAIAFTVSMFTVYSFTVTHGAWPWTYYRVDDSGFEPRCGTGWAIPDLNPRVV